MPLETLTMRPQPRLTIPSSNARVSRIGPTTFTARARAHWSGSTAAVGPMGVTRRGIVHHDVDVSEGGLCLRGDERGGVRIADVGPDLHGPAPGCAHVGGYVQKFLANGVGCSRFACGPRSSA